MKLYAIKDTALGAYTNLMVFPSEGVAIRAFTNEANRRESEINVHPKDYELHHIGEWDERTGQVSNGGPEPTVTIRAIQIITKD